MLRNKEIEERIELRRRQPLDWLPASATLSARRLGGLLVALRLRAGDSGGSRRFLGLPLRTEIRIPAPEGILPLFVEHPSSYLQEEMCALLAQIGRASCRERV